MTKQSHPEANIFYPDTRFERLARRSGGVRREQALARAQAEVEDLTSEFRIWIDKQLEELNSALSRIESNPSDEAALERAYYCSSQLRDVGGTMGYELVTFIAKTLCEILDAYMAGAAYDKDVIDCHSNAFMLAKTEQYRHLRPEQVPEMTNGLLRVVCHYPGTDTHGLKAFRREALLETARRCGLDRDVFASEFVIRAHREGKKVVEIPFAVREKRPPSINLAKRVPHVELGPREFQGRARLHR